jgi:malate dehydrogenase
MPLPSRRPGPPVARRGRAGADADSVARVVGPGYIWRLNIDRQPRVNVMMNKITVVGAGNVGATAAQRLAEKNLARTIVMVDVAEGIPQGKALDQWQSGPIEGYDTRVIGANDYEAAAGSDIFVVTAGIARKPGMSRDDLVKTNAGIVQSVAKEIARVAPQSIIVVVSNPLDVMCYVAMKASGFPRERVLGMAGVLDTARYRTFLAEAMQVSVEDIQAMVLGGHGDTMVPLISCTTVSGMPVTQLLAKDKLDAIVARTRNGGAEIVAHLKTGSAYYAPSAAAVQMVEAIVLDKKRVVPCAAWLQGEYGLTGMFCGVPCKIGRGGLEQIIEVALTEQEKKDLHASAEAVRSIQASLSV